MRTLWLTYATGITLTSITINAFDPFARESLELEFLRKRHIDTSAASIDIDPENNCKMPCTPFLIALHACDIVVNAEIIDYTACLCETATFNDLTSACYVCVEGLGNETWTEELGLWLELCTATGLVNSSGIVDSSVLPNGRGQGTNGGGANLTISRSVVGASGFASGGVSGGFASMTSVASTSMSSAGPVSSGMKTYSVVSGVLGLSILFRYLLL